MTIPAETTPSHNLPADSKEQQGILAAIVSTSDDTILSKTLQGIITSWNTAAERMFGYTAEEAVGKHISLIIPTSRLSEEEYIIGRIKAGLKVDHFETIRIAKSGKEIPISLSVSPVMDRSGKVIGASKIARDISSRLEAQETAARLYDQVKDLNQKKDEFIRLASHELKTPLTGINGYLQILSKVNTDENSRKYIDKTLQQVKKLTTLVNGILEVSRIETDSLKLETEEFDLKEAIDDSIELAMLTTDSHQIIFKTELPNCKIIADRSRIEMVLSNLLSNAIKYSPGKGNIEVSLNATTNKVKVSVKDNGMGIAADNLEHIFNRFYRVDEATNHISGLGIGLYLSHEIISRHKGILSAKSEPGKGSTFWFSLPL